MLVESLARSSLSYPHQKFQEGIDYWRVAGAPAPKTIKMSEEDLALAHLVNTAEFDIVEETEEDPTTLGICLAHVGVKYADSKTNQESPQKTGLHTVNPPPAPTKKSRDVVRPRLPTDTRDDILESSSDDSDLCGWLEFMRRGVWATLSASYLYQL